MAQTFDIRFARSAGLAAMLEVPENAFRWKGGGLLRIDAHGISIGLKRGLLALSGGKHTQRIPTENLRAVYREGDALRVEFQDGETRLVVLPFWADDRDTAAQIVRLLPTSQTVEMEHSTDATHSGKPRADWRMLLSTGVVIAVFVVGTWAVFQRAQEPDLAPSALMTEPLAPEWPVPVEAPDTSTLQGEGPASPATGSGTTPDFLEPAPVVLSPPGSLPLPRDYVRPGDLVIPIARGTAAYEVVKREFALFERETARLEAGYRAQHNLLIGGALTPEDFAAKLDDYEMRWWDLTFRIFDNEALAAPALLDVRAAMLGTARLWRSFLSTYADGLRKRDHVMMARSFDDLTRAQELQSRARLFLR